MKGLRGYLLPILFLLLGLGALAVAGYLYVYCSHSPAAGPRLVVDEPDRVFDGAVVKHRYDLEFRIVNRSDKVRRVIGSEFT